MILILYFLYLIRSVRLLFFYLYLYDLKEYRIDRMLAHLTTIQGKKLIYNPLSVVKWIILFLIILKFRGITILFVLISFIYIFEIILFAKDLVLKKIFLPDFKIRKIGIIIYMIIFQIILIQFFRLNILNILIFDKIFPLAITSGIILSNLIFNLYKKRIIGKAVAKLNKYPQIKIIGITGSYGKTSTKNFLYSILSQKFNVSKTARSINTAIGVCEHILNNINEKTEIFIVEMAAYKIGEIKEIARIVKPNIGIITAVGNQHLSLFGSIENLTKAKFELIESLDPKSLAIINMDNTPYKRYKDLAEKTGKRVVLTGKTAEADFYSSEIKENKFNLIFLGILEDKKDSFQVNLLGRQNIDNLLPAIYCARELGLNNSDINRGLKRIKPENRTMFPVRMKSQAVLIDDTFNANPQAVFAALKYLRLYKGKRYMILQPLIELGIEAEVSHIEIGKESVNVCNEIFLTNNNYYESFVKNLTVGEKQKIKILDPIYVSEKLQKILGPEDVCLFEGKEAEKVLFKMI